MYICYFGVTSLPFFLIEGRLLNLWLITKIKGMTFAQRRKSLRDILLEVFEHLKIHVLKDSLYSTYLLRGRIESNAWKF